MSFNDDWLSKGLPVYNGGKDKTQARKMLDRMGGPSGFKTAFQTNQDGTVTTVQTKGDMAPQVSRTQRRIVIPSTVIGNMAPTTDYYTQGFDYFAGAVTTSHYGWPTKPWAKLTPNGDGIQELSANTFHPGSTSWVDTRTTGRQYTKTLTWDCPYGGRGGTNDTTFPVYNPVIVDRGDSAPSVLTAATAYRGMQTPGYPKANGSGFRTIDSKFRYTFPYTAAYVENAGSIPFSQKHNTPGGTWSTKLYENGVELFAANIITAAAKVVSGSTQYVIISGDVDQTLLSYTYSPPSTAITMSIVTKNAAGTTLSTVAVSFPNDVHWVLQVPFINSSATKAIGIFRNEMVLALQPRIYEIDLVTGVATDLGAASSGTATNYTITFACDYIGDTAVYATKTSINSVNTIGTATTAYTTTASDQITLNYNGVSYVANTSFSQDKSSPPAPAITTTVISAEGAEPVYTDLRFNNYIIDKSYSSCNLVKTSTYNGSNYDVTNVYSGNNARTEAHIYLGGVLAATKPTLATYALNGTFYTVEAFAYDFSTGFSVPASFGFTHQLSFSSFFPSQINCTALNYVRHCQAFSKNGAMLLSLVGVGDDKGWANNAAQIRTYNGYITPGKQQTINMATFTYDGVAKWFYDPYLA